MPRRVRSGAPGHAGTGAAARVAVGLLLPFSLTGCGALLSQTTADLAAIGGATAAAAVTESAALATGIGLGVEGLAEAGLEAALRRVHRNEQEAIASAAGPLGDGEVARWEVRHSVPLEPDRQGEVVVARAFGSERFRCKEIVFSIEELTAEFVQRDFFATTICQDGTVWRWASAEPATSRWGALQ
jgi:hypothetical protein